jgi:Flp pilus assembly pilin Flp
MRGRSLRHRLQNESGQDLIEYGLLLSIVVLAGVLIFPSIQAAMGVRFGAWGDAVYDLWAPKDPGA